NVRTGQTADWASLRPDQATALTGEQQIHQPAESQDAFDLPGEPLQWWNRVHDEITRNPDGPPAKKLRNLSIEHPEVYAARHQAAQEDFKVQQAKRADAAKLEHDKHQAAIKQADELRKEAVKQAQEEAKHAR